MVGNSSPTLPGFIRLAILKTYILVVATNFLRVTIGWLQKHYAIIHIL